LLPHTDTFLSGYHLNRINSFPPIIAPNATVLLLGSMPGGRSLQVGQYYANPHNLFWLFMEELYGVARTLPYAERLAALQAQGIALWDVLKECEREGSLDVAIVPASEVPNDFATLLTSYPLITRIGLNGSKAATTFMRHVLPSLPSSIRDRLTLFPLPSTSPAHRTVATATKLDRWRAALLP
jgi:hypoxanthine-DNA glycosylase